MIDLKAFYESEITFNKNHIAWCDKMIAYCNEMLKSCRKDDRDLVQHIWARGVVTELEMKIFNKDYVSSDTQFYIDDRKFYYKSRRKARKQLEKYNLKLAKVR